MEPLSPMGPLYIYISQSGVETLHHTSIPGIENPDCNGVPLPGSTPRRVCPMWRRRWHPGIYHRGTISPQQLHAGPLPMSRGVGSICVITLCII